MVVTVSQTRDLLESELGGIADPERRRRLQCCVTEPELRSFGWYYGEPGERHDAWGVGSTPDGSVLLVYDDQGFGPEYPWGFVFASQDSLGYDAQWHLGLEHAAIGAGILEAPPGYEIP